MLEVTQGVTTYRNPFNLMFIVQMMVGLMWMGGLNLRHHREGHLLDHSAHQIPIVPVV